MAKKFYNKCGYKIVSLNEYIEKTAEFPYINLDYDFQLGEELAEYIVIKKILKKIILPMRRMEAYIVMTL